MGVFVRLFACLPIRVSLCFLGWLVGCWCLCVLVCFSAPCGTFSRLIRTLGNLFVLFLHFGGPWDSIVTLGAPLCQPWWTFLHDFRTWWDLGAQFADFWAPFGRPWDPFWCIFTALGPDPGPLFRLSPKSLEKGPKKKRKRELKWMHFL